MSRGVVLLAFSVLPPITVPEVTLPPVTIPDVTVPEVTLPPVTVPEVTLPPITVPEVTLPEVTLPTLPTTTTVATTRTNGSRSPAEPDAVTSKPADAVVDQKPAISAGEAPTVDAEPVASTTSGAGAEPVGGPTAPGHTVPARRQGTPTPTVQGRSLSVPATLATGDSPNSGNLLAEAMAAVLLLGVGLATGREARRRPTT